MKIGIITFQETNNYGAILQNYALQQALIKKGHQAETIDYKSRYIGKPYRFSHLKNKGLFAYLFGVMGYMIYMPRTAKCNRFKKKIQYSRAVKREELDRLNQEYDCFITGSDQVWNYKLTGMDATYLLDFVEDKRKCNSFAASVGLSEIESEKQNKYRELLQNYNRISVRERSAGALLEPILDKQVEVVSDPCILLTKEEWKEAAAQMREPGSYVLVYQLGVSPDVVRRAKKIAAEKNLKVVYVPFPVGDLGFGTWDMFAGNAELLGYLKDAAYVVTDSFHGTLLSIIFNKLFFTKVSGTHSGVGSRITDMLTDFGLQDRIIGEDEDCFKGIDYDRVNQIISRKREAANLFLDSILK